MDLSIVIVSWNVQDKLFLCLKTLYLYNKKINFEVFVVDNNSHDDSAVMIKKHFPQVILIENKENLGFAKANNQAIKKAHSNNILLLNPDCEFIENSLEKLITFLSDHPDAEIVGCRLLNPDKTLQPSVRSFPTLYTGIILFFKLHHIFSSKIILKKYLQVNFDYQKTQLVDQVMGAFLFYKKALGLLDENYFIWFEEVDLCKRSKRVYFTPDINIIHYGGSSFAQVKTVNKQKYFYQSLLYYFKKNGLW